jgi:uncharacterized membrane protein
MTELFTAVGLFVFTHLLPAIQPLRAGVITRIGRRAYFTLFSIISIAATAWLFFAYSNAPYVEVWAYHPWTRWAVLAVMPVVCILVVAGLTSPNPYSLSMNSKPFDPTRPGLPGRLRHPVILGLALWSGVHMLPNGDVASLTLFGLLTALGISGPRTLERRRSSAMGETAWTHLNTTTREPTVIEVLRQTGVLKMIGGILLYVALIYLHEPVIGISPLDG